MDEEGKLIEGRGEKAEGEGDSPIRRSRLRAIRQCDEFSTVQRIKMGEINIEETRKYSSNLFK